MKLSTKCPACEEAESVKHMLFLCPKAKQVWYMLGLQEVIERGCAVDRAGEAVLEYLLSVPANETMVLGQGKGPLIIAIACWFLWWERRKLVHGEHTQQPNQIVLSIRALAENFSAAATSSAKEKRNP